MAQWLDGQVVESINWTEQLFSLRVKTAPFSFTAGQFVRLALDLPQGRAQRAYSLVNGPDDPILEFLVTRIDDGRLTPALHALKAGDAIQISQPASGFFTLDEVPDGDSLWLLATGTGIGPYLSMLATDQPWQRFKRIHLVHGVRYQADLAYQALIGQWQARFGDRFRYQGVVTREPGPDTLAKRLPELIEKGELEQALGDKLDDRAQIMLCGNPAMIKDSLKILADKGLNKNLRRKPGQVTVEQYW